MTNPIQAGTLAAGSVLETVIDIATKTKNAASHMKTSTLTNITSVARVEPIVIVDQDCLHLDYLPEVLQSTQSIFIGYWLQALSLITTVAGVKVGRILDKLNPNRKLDTSAFTDYVLSKTLGVENHTLSLESYKWKLPTLATESDKGDKTSNFGKTSNEIAASLANLSIGKVVDVSIKMEGQEAKVPVSFRLLVNTLPASSIVTLLATGATELSLKERWFKWRAGRISFVKDLILCQDLIKEHKKSLMTDKDGVFSEIYKRAKNSKLASAFSKNPSLAEASNIIIISEETSTQLKLRNNLNVDNFKDRQAIFDKTYAMILVVIDRNYERVNFYHSGLRLPTSVSLRDIKISNKNNGPDLMDILSAYKKGDAPMF